jgi:hypothetical protein
LLDILDPEVVERVAAADRSLIEVRGARTVASRAKDFSLHYADAWAAWVNGWPGWITYRHGAIYSVGALAISDGRIYRMDVIIDPARLTGFRILASTTRF